MSPDRLARRGSTWPRPLILASAIVAGLLADASSPAQCPGHWLPGGGLPGADRYVAAATSWDPDGAGPGAELLVIAGGFEVIGNQVLRGLAGWDGQTWREIDPNSQGDIYTIAAIAVYQGDLIVAGNFSTPTSLNHDLRQWTAVPTMSRGIARYLPWTFVYASHSG